MASLIEREPCAGELLAFDPSTSSAGAALFRSGKLRAAKRITMRGEADEGDGARWLRMARRVVEWVVDLGAEPRTLAWEVPQFYGVGTSEVPPQKLAALIGVGGSLQGLLQALVAQRNIILDIRTFLPAEWANGTSKETEGDPWVSSRGVRVAKRLSPEERVVVPDSHDAIDAVAIGLHTLGRWKPHRVLPGAE